MIKENTYVVIMAGGVGSRFWPYSRKYRPKQFLDVLDTGSSLIQLTNDRFKNICPQENVYVVTNDSYVDLVKSHIPELSDDQILSEPVGKNTAPCIAYASYKIASKNPNANIIVTPSDHTVFKAKEFEDTVEVAIGEVSSTDHIVTIGIKPSRPETGYGYIQFLPEGDRSIKKVKTFTEKPELELAMKFLESGDFVWNAGIFIWNVNTIKSAFESYLPDMAELFDAGGGSYFTDRESEFIKDVYAQCKNISIDYGVMEKASNVYVVEADFGWSDIGSWATLHELKSKDENNNVFEANTLAYDTKDCIIQGPEEKLIVVQGLEGYLVADIDNVLLVCEKGNERQFRKFISDLKTRRMTDYL